MENIAERSYHVYCRTIQDFHVFDDVNKPAYNPFPDNSLENVLYHKNWIDTVQWHLEDIIRDPDIDSTYGISVKRKIDDYNQRRTDIVELIDDYFLNVYGSVVPKKNARHNTESLGWALDRLSILCLKEYHLNVELNRSDASIPHIDKCLQRKAILGNQKNDLMRAIDWLLDDVRNGRKIIKVYKQLKMYNEPSFNPVLYRKQQTGLQKPS